CQVVLDDESVGPSIQTVVTANAPFTGSFLPAFPLSGFDGENPNGNWTISVQDFFSSDTGVLRAFSVVVTSQATGDVTSAKTVAGDFAEGGTVTYTVTNANNGNSTVADNPGDEFTDVLPAGLSLVSASATSGTAVATIGTNTVTWNGSLAPASSVTLTITATVNAGTQNQVISNQGSVSFDSDIDGTNDASGLSDDPAVGGASDPTSLTVGNITPTVTIVQAVGQADPTTAQPVHFTATFSEVVTGFDQTDVVVSGAVGATTVVVTGAGPVYDVAVSGALGFGAITVSIPAGAAVDNTDTPNLASTSSDDTVTLAPVPTTTTTTLPRGLPATGSKGSGLPLGVGIAALLAGGGMVLASRRRLHHSN
ncbi:MAG: LPXTG cell wall anchor domain-containing protein, partial [Actinomycetota bacterium]|nr:LPXTG cell wall anchor domain-containing protein [Actinomycetota bacterium]